MKNNFFLVVAISLIFPAWAIGEEGKPISFDSVGCSGPGMVIEILVESDDIRIPNSNRLDKHVIRLKDGSANVEGTENKRKTRLSEDLATLLKINEELGAEMAGDPCYEFQQSYKRSTISLETKNESGEKIGSYTLITGPDEHWYLSADMPVNSVKQLDFDLNSGSISEKEKPASFYIGINRKFGDVFTNYKSSDFRNNLSLKLMLQASSKPSESMGLGLAYSFEAFDVFISQVWTKNDESVPENETGHTDSTIFGISFNLSKGLEWLKSDS